MGVDGGSVGVLSAGDEAKSPGDTTAAVEAATTAGSVVQSNWDSTDDATADSITVGDGRSACLKIRC